MSLEAFARASFSAFSAAAARSFSFNAALDFRRSVCNSAYTSQMKILSGRGRQPRSLPTTMQTKSANEPINLPREPALDPVL